MPFNMPGGSFNSGYGSGANKTATKSTGATGAGTAAILSKKPYFQGGAGSLVDPVTNTPATPAKSLTVRAASGTGGVSPNPSSAPVYDKTGRLVADGTSPYVADPSAGQVAAALAGIGPVFGTLNRIAGAALNLAQGKPVVGETDDGGLLGRMLDGARGVSPGPVTGYSANRVASNTNTRGTRPADDPRTMDSAAQTATAAMTGDVNTGGASTDFSGVMLRDRRKPYPPGSPAYALQLLGGL